MASYHEYFGIALLSFQNSKIFFPQGSYFKNLVQNSPTALKSVQWASSNDLSCSSNYPETPRSSECHHVLLKTFPAFPKHIEWSQLKTNGHCNRCKQRHRSVREDVMSITASCLRTVAEWLEESKATDILTVGQTGWQCHLDCLNHLLIIRLTEMNRLAGYLIDWQEQIGWLLVMH